MSAITLSCGMGAARLSETVPAPILQAFPTVTGPGREATALSADLLDVWTVNDLPATVIQREYRLLVDGSVVSGPQPDPDVTLPADTAGLAYSFQLRAETAEAVGQVSAWVALAGGIVAPAAPQAVGTLPAVDLAVGAPDRVIDLGLYFSGSNLAYALHSGSLPQSATLTGSVLTIPADAPFGPVTVVIRASNSGGFADQSLEIRITETITAPAAFLSGDWGLAAAPVAGGADITLSALPMNGGSPVTDIEYSIDAGGFASIGGANPGVYRITGLGIGQTRLIALRAVNAAGNGPVGNARSVTTANVPAAFGPADWNVSDPGTGTGIRITILTLPAGGNAPLTRLEHDIDGAGWAAFTTDPATGTFDIAGLTSPGVMSTLSIRAVNAIGSGTGSDLKSVTPAGSALGMTGTVDGEIEIDGATGEITLTVTAPAIYADYDTGNGPGVFVFDSADLDTGPINLVPPRIIDDGTPADGEELTRIAGLWAYDGDNAAPTIALQWQADNAGNGIFADIAGATGAAYTLTASESGDGVRLVETATDAHGNRFAASAPVGMAGSGSGVATHMGAQALDDIATPTPSTMIDVSGYSAGEKIITFYNSSQPPVSATLNGNSMGTPVATWSIGSGRRGAIWEYTLTAADITAGIVTVEVTIPAARTLHVFDFLHTVSGSVTATSGDSILSPESLSATVSNASNTVFHFAGGQNNRFEGTNGLVYTAGIPSRIYNHVNNSSGGAAGIAQNVPTGSHTVEFTLDGAGDGYSIMIVVE